MESRPAGTAESRPPAEPPPVPAGRRLVAGARRYVTAFVDRFRSSRLMRVLVRFERMNGRDRAFLLAGQVFTTVIPLLIVMGTVAGRGGTSVADRINRRFRLHGPSADALRTLFERPPGATGTVTVVGVLLLLLSLVSLTRSIQRTFEEAWRLPAAGLRGTVHGMGGVGLLLASLLVLSLLVSALRPLPAGTVLALVVRTLLGVVVFLLLLFLLLSRRVPLVRLLPGALVGAVGQSALAVYSSAWMPHVIGQNAEQYGVIGVTFAIVSWLVVLGLALVALAVVSAELGGADRPPEPSRPADHGGRFTRAG